MNRCTFFAFSMFLFGCEQADFAPPSCRAFALTKAEDLVSSSQQGACISRFNSKLLVIERPSGKYDLAYSTNLSGDDAQILQCKAHQATWNQTGFNVEVGPKLAVQKDGTHLFNCLIQAGIDGTEGSIDSPPWRPMDVERLVFIHPFEIEQDQWENPDHFTTVRDAFVASAQVSQIHRINTSD